MKEIRTIVKICSITLLAFSVLIECCLFPYFIKLDPFWVAGWCLVTVTTWYVLAIFLPASKSKE